MIEKVVNIALKSLFLSLFLVFYYAMLIIFIPFWLPLTLIDEKGPFNMIKEMVAFVPLELLKGVV